MKLYSILLIVSLFIIAGCAAQRSKNVESWSESQASEWFDHEAWLNQIGSRPDQSINKKEFAVRYHKNRKRWDIAFAFLKDTNLDTLKVGNHELDGKNVFVKVTEYNSKNPEDVFYESHKNYSDIQYVVSGQEYIGIADMLTASVKIPYNEEKDILFYSVQKDKNLIAKPGTFFIFFPQELHRPGIKVGNSAWVKKIVIKVRD